MRAILEFDDLERDTHDAPDPPNELLSGVTHSMRSSIDSVPNALVRENVRF